MKRLLSPLFAANLITAVMLTGGFGEQLSAGKNDAIAVRSIRLQGRDAVRISFSRDVAEMVLNDFIIRDPLRLVLDIPGTVLAVKEKVIPGSAQGWIKNVRSAQHTKNNESVVRVVLDLNKQVPYDVSRVGSDLVITAAAGLPRDTQDSIGSEDEIDTGYDTGSGENKPSSAKGTAAGVAKDGKKVNEIVSIINNLSMQPVTLDFNEADLGDVFRILSAKSGVNIIYGEDVQGELSIHLEQVPFKEAFKTILSLKSLVAQQVGENILRIITPDALATQRSKSVTFWRVFPLNYADVKDAKRQIDAIRGAEGRRGTIEIDSRTNSLIVADSPEGLDDIQRLIREIDLKPQQVLIESRFVEVALDNQLNLGVQWGYMSVKQDGNKTTQIGGGKVEYDKDTFTGQGTEKVVTVDTSLTGVNAAIPGQVGSFMFGLIDDESAFVARLAALAKDGKAKFLSNPRITTLNNQEARIWIGSQIPIRTTALSESGTIESVVYKQVGIELKVTPTINVDNRITLEVRPEVSLPDTSNVTPEGDIPINTRYAETTVLIQNNETLVIGGFIEESKTEGVDKVPLLGDIPVLGQFFRSNLNRKIRRELLVFITPKILED